MAAEKKSKYAGRKLKGGKAKANGRTGVRYDPKSPDYTGGGRPPSNSGHGPGRPTLPGGAGKPGRGPGGGYRPPTNDERGTRGPRRPPPGGDVIIRPMPGEPGGGPYRPAPPHNGPPPNRKGGDVVLPPPIHGPVIVGDPDLMGRSLPPAAQRLLGQIADGLASAQARYPRSSPPVPPSMRPRGSGSPSYKSYNTPDRRKPERGY